MGEKGGRKMPKKVKEKTNTKNAKDSSLFDIDNEIIIIMSFLYISITHIYIFCKIIFYITDIYQNDIKKYSSGTFYNDIKTNVSYLQG